jgi:transposase
MDRTYIGLDLHTTQVTIHQITVSDNGTVRRTNAQYAMEKVETVFLPKLTADCAVCLEAGCGSHALARMIVDQGGRAFVVNPLSMPQIYRTGKKTDHIDAKKLADCLKAHMEGNDPQDGFPEVYVPDIDSQRLRMLVTQYQHTNMEITAIRNNLYSVFRQWMVHVDKGLVIDKLEAYLSHPRLPPEVRMIARHAMEHHDQLLKYKDELRSVIEKIGVLRYPEEVSLLIGIDGISVFGASIIMSDIITIERFRSRKNLASYLRAAPRVDASNQTIHIGRLNKAGRKASFQMLLQGINHMIDHNPFLARYSERVVGNPRNKIRATIVGRSITQFFYMLKNREPNRFLNKSNFKEKQRQVEKLKLSKVA